jgi:MoaA/NifB/PqqE/SkfB family radical SAM enzyme
MEVTKRVKIVTGLKCNIQCVFCYYRDNLHAPNRKFEEIRSDLLYARNRGITEVDFSGGEPTVHPDLPRVIEEAKSIGVDKVCIISNGLRFANKEYAATLKNAGLDEILFSVHGSSEKTHDEITRIQGSFRKISKAISNASSEGIQIRTNTVVNRINYNDLMAIGNFLIPFHPVQMNFITINDWCFAKNLVEKLMLSYSEMSSKLKEVCDLLDPHVSAVNVRYIPFCFMKGYEKFVCNHRQVKFDPYEWVPRVRARLEIQNNFWRYLGILGYGYSAGGVFRKTFRMSPADILDESVVEALRRWYYKKSESCEECNLESICDGVEKTYDEQFGLDELNPFVGEKITDPVFFRSNAGSCNNAADSNIEERACHL